MAKKTKEEFAVVKKNDMPKFIIALLIFGVSIYFILTQFGFIKTNIAAVTVLDIVPAPTAVSSTGFDKETLDLIVPCENASISKPVPGENCMTPYYKPGADPIQEPEGRPNPFDAPNN